MKHANKKNVKKFASDVKKQLSLHIISLNKNKMKTKQFLAAIFFVLISSVTFGAKPEAKIPNNLVKHISEKIIYPSDALESKMQGFVLVSFVVNSEGFVEVEGINSDNEELKEFVEKELLSIRLCPYDLSVGKTFNYKFVFTLM